MYVITPFVFVVCVFVTIIHHSNTQTSDDDDWNAIGLHLANLTAKYNEMKSNFTRTAVEIPKLTTFEQLLATIDDETKDNNSNNNSNSNKNKDGSVTTSNKYNKMSTNSDHKENNNNKTDNSGEL